MVVDEIMGVGMAGFRRIFLFLLLHFLDNGAGQVSSKTLQFGHSIDDQGWAAAHRYHFSKGERLHAVLKGEMHFSKVHVMPFSQLIPSWNGARPIEGYFAVYVRVRSQETHRWDDWLHVADWGADGQRSYGAKGAFSTFHYARLEMNEDILADGFEMKVEAHDGASLKEVQLLVASTSNKQYFKTEHYSKSLLQSLESVYLEDVPCISQMIDHPHALKICSPTALAVCTAALYGKLHANDPLVMAQKVYDKRLEIYGNWMFNTAQGFITCYQKIFFYPMRLENFASLHAILMEGIPVVVSIRGTLKGAAKSYPSGHLLVVVGWDKKKAKVICHDSAFKHNHNVEVEYDWSEFVTAWQLSQRLVYRAVFKNYRGGV